MLVRQVFDPAQVVRHLKLLSSPPVGGRPEPGAVRHRARVRPRRTCTRPQAHARRQPGGCPLRRSRRSSGARTSHDPIEPLQDLAAYLVDAYGVDNARAMARSWGTALRAVIDSGGDISLSRAADIRCASLLLTGTGDPVCPPSLVAAMADAMPRGTLREVPGAGHDVHRSHGPWLASTIAEWIGGH